ncbi:MAG: hypothetical protein Q7T55_17280 [Solirubrobacteraceae bacterium]|nr:hypothetical protein [Solirubrobacteraceae bacterium]
MMALLVLAQDTVNEATDPDTTASAAAAVVGVFALIGVLSLVGVASRNGRRLMLPVVTILLGASILATTIAEANSNRLSPITFIGLFFGAVVAIGGVGALREGMVVPEVEGVDPDPTGKTPAPTGNDH